MSKEGVWVAVQESGRNHRGGRLVVNAPGLAAIDPAYAGTSYDVIAAGLVYDGLTAVRRSSGAEGTQVVPDLAETLPAPTNGGTAYTFRLRRGIRYSSGRVVRPEDFRRGLARAVENNPQLAVDLKVIGGAQCKTKHCDLSRGVITGRDSVTFRLTEPNPRLPLLLRGSRPHRRARRSKPSR